MPKYTPQEDEMDGLYPASETEPAETETETETEETPESVDEEAGEEPSALVPKSALAGQKCKVGDTITMKVVADYGDEYELAPISKKPMMMGKTSDQEIEEMDV